MAIKRRFPKVEAPRVERDEYLESILNRKSGEKRVRDILDLSVPVQEVRVDVKYPKGLSIPARPSKIRKRKPASSEYVYVDDKGLLSVKVPQSVNLWANEFRLRMSRFYLKPGTIINKTKFLEDFVNNGWSEKVYTIEGIRVRVYYLVAPATMPRTSLVVNGTVVENIDTGEGIEVAHEDFAFRNLQIYEFLANVEIGGVPTAKRIRKEPPA